MQFPYVLYHDQCMDGMGAAYATWCAMPECKFIGVNYRGHPPQLKAGVQVIMVDYSYSRADLLGLARTQDSVVVLDHHETAQAALAGIEAEAPNIKVVFDMNRSGAGIAWDWFHPGVPRPALIDHVEDRDLWRFRLPGSKAVHAALSSYPQDFDTWHRLAQRPLDTLVQEGAALLRMQALQVESLCRDVRVAHIGGYAVPAVNAPYFLTSEIGHYLLSKFGRAPFSAVYRDRGTGQRDWSLRSVDSRVAVSSIASTFAGGGHRNSAGFSEMTREQFVQFGANYQEL